MNNTDFDPQKHDQTSSTFGQFLADVVASTDLLPTSVRAVLGYYSDSGQFAPPAIKLYRMVNAKVDDMITTAFDDVEQAIAEEFGLTPDDITFEYETKLTMPAELTLGHLYQNAMENTPKNFNPVKRKVRTPIVEYFRLPFNNDFERKRRSQMMEHFQEELEQIEKAEAVTELVTIALIEGDMRDALNDEEYLDFNVVGIPNDDSEKHQVAAIAQSTLQEHVNSLLDDFNQDVIAAYNDAVAASESHQDSDNYFRKLAEKAEAGNEEAIQSIQEEYKYKDFDSPPEIFSRSELEFPYLTTQYYRVGVIYDGMIEMYRAAGLAIEDSFKKAIVLAIIGAQIWLDDIDDVNEDLANSQLTPVTAEYLLNETTSKAILTIESLANLYLSTAKQYAQETNSMLAGIGIEYILRTGNTDQLPK